MKVCEIENLTLLGRKPKQYASSINEKPTKRELSKVESLLFYLFHPKVGIFSLKIQSWAHETTISYSNVPTHSNGTTG